MRAAVRAVARARRGLQRRARLEQSLSEFLRDDGDEEPHDRRTQGERMVAKHEPVFRQRFHKRLDTITFYAKGGEGGDGAVLWYHFKNTEYGGPAGGAGGCGGDVMIQCTTMFRCLMHLVSDGYVVYDPRDDSNTHGVCAAGIGINGDRWGMTGKSGGAVVIPVPPGTVLLDADTNRELCQFTRAGEMYTVAKGGRGGVGNKALRSSLNQAPDYAGIGQEGEGRLVTLELRSIADFAMVGRTNSGRSTLLGAMSPAAPEASSRQYTTWGFHVGTVHSDETTDFTVADLPPLMKGAHLGHGGARFPHDFLRHAYRSHGIVYVVDVCNHEPAADNDSLLEPVPLWQTVAALQEELELYQEGLSHRAVAVAVTKADVLVDALTGEPTWPRIEELQRRINLPVFPVSAHTKKGVLDLELYLTKMIAKARDEDAAAETQRTRDLRLARVEFDRIRYAEYKQVLLQRAQDFHLTSAVEEVLKDRIRGRPNGIEDLTSRVYSAKARVYSPHGAETGFSASGADDGVKLIDCGDASGPGDTDGGSVVDLEAAEEVDRFSTEEWDVGSTDDITDDRRVRRYRLSDLWRPTAIAADAADEAARSESYRDSQNTQKVLQAAKEYGRAEYVGNRIGAGTSLPDEHVEELSQKSQERLAVREQGAAEGRRLPEPEPVSLEPGPAPTQSPAEKRGLPDGSVGDMPVSPAQAALREKLRSKVHRHTDPANVTKQYRPHPGGHHVTDPAPQVEDIERIRRLWTGSSSPLADTSTPEEAKSGFTKKIEPPSRRTTD